MTKFLFTQVRIRIIKPFLERNSQWKNSDNAKKIESD